MNKTLCIYHGKCADGFTAAWVVKQALGNDVEFYSGTYQNPPPDVVGKNVIIVDFSYKKPVIEEIIKHCNSLLILDHHQSAQEDLAFLPEPPNQYSAIFDMERSGAMITWDYFFPGVEPPKLLEHIQDRDLWKFELEGTREIQAAVFSYPYEFKVWDNLMNQHPDDLYMEGEIIERKHFKDINEFIEVAKYRMNIGGHDVPVLNAPYFWSSDAGHIMAANEKFAACYWDTPEGRVFSLRSHEDGMDVSEIAKKFGGGGHKHAAGFRIQLAKEK